MEEFKGNLKQNTSNTILARKWMKFDTNVWVGGVFISKNY